MLFKPRLKIVVINEIINDAQSADQKLSIAKRSLHLAVNINMAALITNANKPRDKSRAGRVNNLIMEPKIEFIKPNKSATQR